jgi:DNA repair protein RadC
MITLGTQTATLAHPREIFRSALLAGACAIAVVHNHPSGDPEPSEEDLRLTAEVVAAARLLDLEFLDHLVIGHGRWASIRSQRPAIWAATAAPD